MTLPPWLTRIGAALAAAAVIVTAWFAAQRVQAKRKATAKAQQRVDWLESNEGLIHDAVEQAEVARAEVRDHATTAEHIRLRTQAKLKKLEETRGSTRARDLADRLGRL